MADNIDYNELKHLIREHTTKSQATAISIPGQPDQALKRFESFFCDQLRDQHERVDLFVKSKADEFRRRLLDYEKKVNKLIGNGEDLQETMRGRKGDRLARLETRAMRYVLHQSLTCFQLQEASRILESQADNNLADAAKTSATSTASSKPNVSASARSSRNTVNGPAPPHSNHAQTNSCRTRKVS